MRVGVYSDSRPTDNKLYWETLKDRLQKQYNCSFAINCGDFTEWSWPWEYSDYVKRLPEEFKVHHVIGNHDDRLLGPWLFRRYLKTPFNYVVEADRWSLIMIRNAYVLKYGITKSTSKWLHKQIVEAGKARKHVGVFSHVPPQEAFKDLGLPEKKLLKNDRLTEVIRDFNGTVKFAFYGHSHLYAHSVVDRIHWYVSGGAALEEDLHPCPENPPHTLSAQHAVLLDLDNSGTFKTTLIRTDGTIDDRYTLYG